MPTMQLDRLSFKWTSSTIIAATLCIAPAKADDIKVTYTGFVSDNASNCGAVFGSGSIVGAEFTLTYQFDSSLGLLKSGEATSTLIGGVDENGQNAPGKGVLEIKGATYTVFAEVYSLLDTAISGSTRQFVSDRRSEADAYASGCRGRARSQPSFHYSYLSMEATDPRIPKSIFNSVPQIELSGTSDSGDFILNAGAYGLLTPKTLTITVVSPGIAKK